MNATDEAPESYRSPTPETDAMLFSFLLEHIPDRIYFKDKSSRFLRVSRAKAERHGISDPSSLIGKIDLDLFTLEHAMEALADEQHILRTGEAIVGKVEKETLPNGQTKWALTTKMPLRNACGETIGTCGISKDVTPLKEMEEALAAANTELGRTLAELKQTHEALKAAQGQLLEAERAQTAARLAAGVAHEVRNPLNILGTGLDFLSAEPAISGDATASTVIAEMRGAIQRAEAIICALIDTSRDVPLNLERCDLRALIEAALTARRRDIAAGRVTVTKELADDLPSLMLDRKRIATALDAVVVNALDAMSASGGLLLIRTRAERLTHVEHDPGARAGQRHHEGDSVVSFEVEDSGCGIPVESLAAIFDPFFTTKPTGSGTGLGLTVCRKILELHGGSIAVTNRPEGGVKVRIVIPTNRNLAQRTTHH